jgi:hypothetical protein
MKCDVAESLPGSKRGMRLVRPMGAIRIPDSLRVRRHRVPSGQIVRVRAQFRYGGIAPAAAFLSVARWRKRSADP